MPLIRVTKEFHFEMAHLLEGYDGPCRNVHGHSYRLEVTVIGQPNAEKSCSKYGMVMDFGELKDIVNRKVVARFDHVLLVYQKSEIAKQRENLYLEKMELVDYQPTCENMLIDIARLIAAELPKELKLHHLKLHETANSYAEWYASDNE